MDQKTEIKINQFGYIRNTVIVKGVSMKGENVKKNQIITVASVVGEFVGKFDEENETTITLTDPRMIVNTPEGMGFARGICQTGKENPDTVTLMKANIIFVSETNDDVVNSYRQFTTGLVMP